MVLFRGEIVFEVSQNGEDVSKVQDNFYSLKIQRQLRKHGDALYGVQKDSAKNYMGYTTLPCLKGFSSEIVHSYSAGNLHTTFTLFKEEKKDGLLKLVLRTDSNNGREINTFFNDLQKIFPRKKTMRQIKEL